MRHNKVALTTVCFHPGFDADVFLKSSSSPLTFDPLRISLQVQLAISLIQKNKSVLTSWTEWLNFLLSVIGNSLCILIFILLFKCNFYSYV